MKKALSFLISAVLILSLCGLSIGMTVGAAAEQTLNDSVYYEDFESYGIGPDKSEEIFVNKLMWFESSHHDTSIVERNGSHVLEYSIIGDDGAGYSRLGGLGTGDGGNLSRLVDGATYTVSMDIEILSNSSSELYIEYKKSDWTGVLISGCENASVLNSGSTFGLKYENGRLEFSFVAGKCSDGSVAYITFTGKGFDVDDKVYVDNIQITRQNEYDIDFEGYDVGTNATSSGSSISNIWNGGDSSVSIAEENGNKFLEITHSSTGGDAWQVVYINNLWNLISGQNYRLTMDVLCAEYAELYLCYPHNTSPNVTYSQNGYVSKSDSVNIIGGSFDGSRLTFDFKPDSNADADFWQQICIVIKHNGDMRLRIDNISICAYDSIVNAITADTSDVKTKYIAGDELSFDGLKISGLMNDGTSRVLNNGEYTIDTSAVNMNNDGEYDVVITAIDRSGNELKTSYKISVHQHVKGNFVKENEVPASCKTAGSYDKVFYCEDCEGEISREHIDVGTLDHKEVLDPAVDPTCTTPGKTEGKHCSECDAVITAQTDIPATGHKWAHATCTDPKTCTVCHETEGEALGHDYDNDRDSTCNTCGYERELPELAWYQKIIEAIIAFFKKIFDFLK